MKKILTEPPQRKLPAADSMDTCHLMECLTAEIFQRITLISVLIFYFYLMLVYNLRIKTFGSAHNPGFVRVPLGTVK